MAVRALPAIRLWQAVAVVAVVLLLFSVARPVPPAVPSPLAEAIEHVRQEVAYVESIEPGLPREYVVALSVNGYINGHISALKYLYRRDIAKLPAPTGPVPAIVDHVVLTGEGLCQGATLAALELYEALGIKARDIEAWYPDPDDIYTGHVTTEVWYDGDWHWFDPTWGAFHRDGDEVLSLVEVAELSRAEQRGTLVQNSILLRTQVLGGMEFVGYSPLMVVLDGNVVYTH